MQMKHLKTLCNKAWRQLKRKSLGRKPAKETTGRRKWRIAVYKAGRAGLSNDLLPMIPGPVTRLPLSGAEGGSVRAKFQGGSARARHGGPSASMLELLGTSSVGASPRTLTRSPPLCSLSALCSAHERARPCCYSNTRERATGLSAISPSFSRALQSTRRA